MIKKVIFLIAITPTGLNAFPEGAPWGSANSNANQNCANCHFDYDAVLDSEYINIQGLPKMLFAGVTYNLIISLQKDDANMAGFQMLASQGQFSSIDNNTEYIGPAIRSTKPIKYQNFPYWKMNYTAPSEIEKEIVFHLAVMNANNDGSPFGDRVHFQSFKLKLK